MTQDEFFNRFTYSVRNDKIGGGGFGTVYKAYDNTLHREVAIKVSEVKTTADGKKTFSLKDEFEALSHVPKHPNIANYEEFYSFEMPNGVFDYAIMQYYPNGNLSEAIHKGLTFEQKEDIALQLLDGIDFLHDHKVVHRDLKPGNILIVRHSGKIIPLITDFGLSKTADAGDRSLFSNSFGGGTARYSSPEQLQGKPLRMNTDLWSYGAIVFELFTGKPLFEAGSSAINTAQADLEIYNKIIHGDTEDRLSDIPDKWRKVLERCMVVDPEKRAKSAEELRNMLNESVDRDDTIISDKTTETIEEKHPVEDDHTVFEYPKPSKEKQDVPTTNSVSVPSSPISKKKQKKVLPWIVGIVTTAIVVLVVMLLVTKDKGKKNTIVDETNATEESVNNVSDVEIPTEETVLKISDPETKALAKTYTVNGVSFTMKYVEGGTFQMGNTPEQKSGDYNIGKPVHKVTVSDFCIGETEVTQSLWLAVMGKEPQHEDGWTEVRGRGKNHPVYYVSWEDCQEFINKLNKLTGQIFRLPTEAEWEYAARGGKNSKAFMYSGGNNVDLVAWHYDNSGYKSHPVKGKKPNELGLYDMSGNVSEWCYDNWGEFSSDEQCNPKGPSTDGSYHVERGGNWLSIAGSSRIYYRGKAASPRLDRGFRLVLVP